ncbi:hypothetical protein [Micromonospora sp. HM5-17]|uniref:hypothetical protein n=1 Tax=Micromonospora sp. HM5-17 TaxID=2487710 RepID=UPI001F2A2B5B|nr:hypothetical protein [Micromonospora sp. HM5-17]
MSTQTPSRQSMDQQQITEMQSAPTRELPGQNISNRQIQQTLADMQARMDDEARHRGRGTETKPSFLSTELYVYLLAVGGVLGVSAWTGTNAAGVDRFPVNQAWFFVTLLTIAYLGSRGLAKLGNAWRRSGR